MAYAATVTVLRSMSGGRRRYTVTVTETECATTSEWSTAASTGGATGVSYTLPTVGRIVSRKVNKVSGTAATVAQVLGRTTGITAVGVESVAVEAAASAINSIIEIPFALPGGVLFGRSTPDAGTNNVITTEIVIMEGA